MDHRVESYCRCLVDYCSINFHTLVVPRCTPPGIKKHSLEEHIHQFYTSSFARYILKFSPQSECLVIALRKRQNSTCRLERSLNENSSR